MLGEEELLKAPYSIENPAHRRAVLAELDRVKTLGVKPPQNLWEYKVSMQVFNKIPFANSCPLCSSLHMLISLTSCQAANAGKSLFLLYALKRSPRLTLFYLYLFDYSETFLPFLHTCCPAITNIDHPVESSFLKTQVTLTQTNSL